MTTKIYLDPAKARCGVAVFIGAELVWAATLHNAPLGVAGTVLRLADHYGCDQLITEWPRKYKQFAKAHKDLDSLEEMANTIAAYLGKKAVKIRPMGWKGGIPKGVTASRIVTALTSEEIEAMRDTEEDTHDAIGVGLFHLKRVGRGMVPL